MTKFLSLLIFLFIVSSAFAQMSGPEAWEPVQTNAIRSWCQAHQKKQSETYRVFPGVVADLQKKEVRVLTEVVGHAVGTTTEFLLVGPLSDRGYESIAITVAKPSDIVRSIEALGIQRGGGVSSIPSRFWPYGEHFSISYLPLEEPNAKEHPFQDLLADSSPKASCFVSGHFVFAGGIWKNGACMADTNMPSSVVSLYNEPSTIFDPPERIGQSEVYGRISTKIELKRGTLLEFVIRPCPPKDGKPRMLPLQVKVVKEKDHFFCEVSDRKGKELKSLPLKETLLWLRSFSENEHEPYITLEMDESLTLIQAAELAKVFSMLDGKGIKLDGKPKGGVFPMAYLPQERWRSRKERTPQPFELHVFRNQDGKIQRKLTFIEEDWNVEGLDPKLTPKDYPFQKWSEFLPLIQKVGGPNCKVNLLFVFAPADMPLNELLPGVEAVSKKLPLVYLFTE